MINFSEFCARRALGRDIEIAYTLLPEVGVNPDDYIHYLFEHPEVWNQEPLKVLKEFNPISAGWNAVKSGVGAIGAHGRAAGYANDIRQINSMSPEELQQVGISPQEKDMYIKSIEQMRAAEAKSGQAGIMGSARQGWRTSQMKQVIDKVQRKLGIGDYSTQQTQQQGQQPQQQQAGYQHGIGQTSPQLQQQAVQALQQHVQTLNQGIQGLNQAVQSLA